MKAMTFFKVRLVFPGSVLHVLSKTEPIVTTCGGKVQGVTWAIVEGTAEGDTVGFIDWSQVAAITWRRHDYE
jgi:hypothetical protein